MAVGDFNGDGKQDLAVANIFTRDVSILLGNGTGNFGSPTNFPVGSNVFNVSGAFVAVGDFSGDSKQDLAAASSGNSTSVSILLRDCPCVVCHKHTMTITLPCNSMEYRRHLDHGDSVGASPSGTLRKD